MSAKSVLIVDDDADMTEALQDALEVEGYQVATARDGFEALDWLRANPPPGVILLDWMMPRCDGRTFRERQKSDPALATIPVILLTADVRLSEKGAQLGVSQALGKPIELSKLLRALAPYGSPA